MFKVQILLLQHHQFDLRKRHHSFKLAPFRHCVVASSALGPPARRHVALSGLPHVVTGAKGYSACRRRSKTKTRVLFSGLGQLMPGLPTTI